MTRADRDFDKFHRLSQTEVAVLAREVLERARLALHDNPAGAVQASIDDSPVKQPHGLARTPAFTRLRLRSLLAGRIRDNFEYATIAFCLIFSGTAWLTQLAGTQF